MHLTSVQPQVYSLDSAEQDTSVLNLIAPYKSELDSSMNEVIGYSENTMVKSRPEMTLGYWMCDAVAMQVEALTGESIDFAALNYGGVRLSELAPGPVTIGEMYELMPFDNMALIITVTGETVMQFADEMARMDGWPVSRHFRMQIHRGQASNVTINNREVNPSQTYRIAIPDFIAHGGDNIELFRGLPTENPGLLVRDALIREVKDRAARGEKIRSLDDGRVSWRSN